MNNNPATADQLLEFASLQTKRVKEVADQEAVKLAIKDKNHPFWEKFSLAVATLVVEVKEVVEEVLHKIKDITTQVVKQKKTADCFTNTERYWSPDGDLVKWLPEDQSGESAGALSVHELVKGSKFKEIAEAVLGETGDVKKLSRLLIERKHTTVLPRIESLIEQQESGVNVGLRTDGYANFFFVKDKDGMVSVVDVNRRAGRWYVSIFRLDYVNIWPDEHRVFVRN